MRPDQVAAALGVYEFTWSPDGKSIAYVSSAAGRSEIWVVSSAGGSPQRLTDSPVLKRQPRWSPDGAWIAYVAVRGEDNGDIHAVSADGETNIALTESPGNETNPAWSPDSLHVAFTERAGARNRILRVNIHTRAVRRLAEEAATDLQWSPDGQLIAFVSDPRQPNDNRRENEDIFVAPSEGGAPRLLTAGTPRFRDASPSWSRDGRRLAYVSDESGYSNVYILDVQTGQRRPLTSGAVDHLSPEWSPDGRRIAYVRAEGYSFQVFTTSVEDGRITRISLLDGVNGGFEDDNAAPRGALRWSPDGARLAFTHSDPARVSDIWAASVDGSRTVQLTNSMPPELRRESRFVWPEKMEYRSFDGQQISALVYKPRGAKPRSGYPALLAFRDSIDGQHAAGWDPFIQMFVNDGYLVFAPNVRGAGGRGREYRQLVFARGGDHDVRDAFFGLDRLSSEGLIDTERVGVFGAGSGGFLTAAAVAKDEARFSAAVSLYGIIDAATAASYPRMSAWSRYMFGAAPLENPFPYYERSLTNFVDKLRTPIIFLFAGQDPSAPIQQLQQFAVQAEVKGKWYDYRIFDNEPGDWRAWREPTLRSALEAMDALFEKHLLGKEREIRLSRNR